MSSTTAAPPCSFLNQVAISRSTDLAVLHLRRDHQVPLLLSNVDDGKGYDEGRVTNTRFGSFPHSTLIGVPWGSQVRASNVDTGSRGRGGPPPKRRKAVQNLTKDSSLHDNDESDRTPAAANSGFVHLLPPTPENWTTSLPHRTQVVYAHDYSYILQRLRAVPGSVIIEAGAGSGSFTHAAARAINGFGGKVLSFEFHQQRFEKLQQELHEHKLSGVVSVHHRDVCENGFEVGDSRADAVFLDLPAPWLALKHLSHESSLNNTRAVRICTFSPCVEQVQRTVSEMRDNGWLDVDIVEVAAKRIEVRRDRIGLHEEGLRGVNVNAASVNEAIARLREIERYAQDQDEENKITKMQRLAHIQDMESSRKLHLEGRIVHRSETELKTHTSYLVFAILPRQWTEEDEQAAQSTTVNSLEKGKSKKQMKREAKNVKN